MLIPLVLASLALLPAQAPPAGATTLDVSAPAKVVTLDKIKGEPIQLAWSPDGTQLYVQTGQRTRVGTFQSPRHYVLTLADQKVKSVDAPPDWATTYFTWKSNKWAPAARNFAISIDSEQHTQRAVAAPTGGDLAKGGADATGTSADDMVSAAQSSQTQHVITLMLAGEVVGKYVDMQFVPGYTFGWAPAAAGPVIAYANEEGHLGLMNQQKDKRVVPGTKNVVLPAWSEDGKQIAFLEKNGKKFDLYLTQVH
ncbi:MAG TPA: hypothetical protein VFX12_05365 [Vicinamibacterales bacterium]|nr:hypothetical protein [Vicinamibacterales bacterium]